MKKAFLNGEDRRTTIRIPADLHKEMRIRAAEADMSLNAYIIRCLESRMIGHWLTDEEIAIKHLPAE